MNIVFFGSGKFAVKILDSLIASGRRIALVVTQPDRQKGRHLHLAPTPIKEYALEKNLEIFQPENINNPENAAFLKKKSADFFVVVSYGRILSKDILALPLKMPVNIHASLLPKYRGAAPINRALMNGEKTTGVSFIRMNERMDQGDILYKKAVRVAASDNAVTLHDRLSDLAAATLGHVLSKIERGLVRPKKQSSRLSTIAPLMAKQDGLIDWSKPAKAIMNQYRGCAGWPGTFTYFRGKILKILTLQPGRTKTLGSAGQIIRADHNALEVACGQGSLVLTEVLPESHKRMPVQNFLSGHQVRVGEILGAGNHLKER